MKRIAKKYRPGQRIVVRSRAEIPPSFASEEEEREWWATHELADELLPDEDTIDRLTEQHQALIRGFQTDRTREHPYPPPAKRKHA